MQFLKAALMGLAALGTLWAAVSTYQKSGVRNVAYPQGVSFRMESVAAARPGAVPRRTRTRSFRGGGLAGGK